MEEAQLISKIDELRKKYLATDNPIDRRVIEIRGKMLKRALEIRENKKPIQRELIE